MRIWNFYDKLWFGPCERLSIRVIFSSASQVERFLTSPYLTIGRGVDTCSSPMLICSNSYYSTYIKSLITWNLPVISFFTPAPLSPGEEHGHPPQYPCLENPMDSGAWQATVHGVAMSPTRLSDQNFHFPLSLSSVTFVTPQI